MTEQSQKLFVFIAKDVPISAIIRKGKMQGRPCYQIIKWDMSTNEFTEGQWLLHLFSFNPPTKWAEMTEECATYFAF